jgi:hypothetical protein
VQELRQAVASLAENDHVAARARLTRLLGSTPDLLTALFSSALCKRLDGAHEAVSNIYLRPARIPQIVLFEAMAEALPLVDASRLLANEFLYRSLAGQDCVSVIDVGVGTGTQMAALVDLLVAQARPPRRITIVGVDPAADVLEQACATIGARPHPSHCVIDCRGIAESAEMLVAHDLARLLPADSALAVNASFALHHVGDGLAKDRALETIAGLRPLAVALTEPDSDHDTDDLLARFDSAWRHYGLVFAMIDASRLDADIRMELKLTFFAREIDDVLGTPDAQRCERHETAQMWLARLQRAGLNFVRPAAMPLPVDRFDVRARDTHLQLEVCGEVLVSQFHAQPASVRTAA